MRALALIALLALAACGFQPVHGRPGGAHAGTTAALAAIAIEAPPGRLGELLKAEIEDRINPDRSPAQPAYKLLVGVNSTYVPTVISKTGIAQRYDIQIDSDYQLIRLSDNAQIASGKLRRNASYTISQADYATYVTRQDAIRRGMIELAEAYMLKLSGFMATQQPEY